MNILISNDDGYQAEGIKILARVVAEFANVRVVAPDRNRTASSSALTLHRPLRIEEDINGFYYVNGTPTDCVCLSLQMMKDFKPDFVFSGINHGANLGDDTIYSGTVAAAREGYLAGIPSIAFSLNDYTNNYWKTAEKFMWKFMEFFVLQKFNDLFLLNINIPKVTIENLKGLKIVKLGRRDRSDAIIKTYDPYGREMYWVGAMTDPVKLQENTDFKLISEGYATLTPLTSDLTYESYLNKTEKLFKDFYI